MEGPTYEAVEAQQAAIRAAIEASQPLVGGVEPTSALVAEYDEAWGAKLRAVADHAPRMRRVRGDGSCFYRAFLGGVLTWLADAGVVHPPGFADADAYIAAATAAATAAPQQTPQRSPQQSKYEALLRYAAADSFAALVALGYADYTLCDFRDALVRALWAAGRAAGDAPPVTHDAALAALGYADAPGSGGGAAPPDPMDSFYVLTYLRSLAALELKSHAEAEGYAAWLDVLPPGAGGGCGSIDAFCSAHVEAVHCEADQLQVLALARGWGVTVRIAYVDAAPSGAGASGGSATAPEIISFPDDGGADADAGRPVVHLLYRPGHYDMLFLNPPAVGGAR